MDYLGETVIVNDEDEEEYDDKTLESLSQYSVELDARMDSEFGNEQGGDVGGWDGNDEGGPNNDGGARVGDEDDLEDMIRFISPLTMGVEKIHTCPNQCILFHGETFKSLDKCLQCGPAGTRTMTFMAETKPPRRKKGIRRVQKRWYKNLSPQRTLH